MKESDKLKVTDNLGTIECYDLEVPFKDLLHWVKEMIQKYGGNAKLVYDKDRYFDYDENSSPCFRITRTRFETDEEVEQRLQKRREYQEKEDFKAYQEFKRLKARFEQKS